MVKGTNIFAVIALGLLPLALSVGCQKGPSQEEIKAQIIAEYEAKKAEDDRVAKMEAELAELKEQQAANAEAQKIKDEQIAAAEKQVAAQKARANQAAKNAEAAKAGKTQGDDGQQVARPSVITVPQGTQLAVTISEPITTETHKVGDSWSGQLASDVVAADGQVVWKAGARAAGTVSASTPAGRLANGEGTLAIKLTELGGAAIDGGIYAVQGDAKGTRNASVIATTTALGALAGILSSKNNKKDHALGGAAIGAAAGAALAAGTATTVITIPASKAITFQMPSEERVVVRNR